MRSCRPMFTVPGFGDITLAGTTGRLISVVIMIFGVTLFLRLAQVLFRPNKVRFPCPTCGLQRHEPFSPSKRAVGESPPWHGHNEGCARQQDPGKGRR